MNIEINYGTNCGYLLKLHNCTNTCDFEFSFNVFDIERLIIKKFTDFFFLYKYSS